MDPTNASGAIVYGIVSGVVTTAILSALVQGFRKIFLPWYHNFVYRGIRVHGEWKVVGGGSAQTAKLVLTQQAERISGTCTFIRLDRDDESDTPFEDLRTCTISGTIRDRFVELSFRHFDQTRLGAGVFLLDVVGDGRYMNGQQTFYSVISSQIVSRPVMVTRPDVLPPFDPAQLPLPLLSEGKESSRKPKKGRRGAGRRKRPEAGG